MTRHIISGIIGGAKVKRTHLSTWRMLLNIVIVCCTIILIKHIHNCNHDKVKYWTILWASEN